jgi:arylsulfatase A-like enzyme
MKSRFLPLSVLLCSAFLHDSVFAVERPNVLFIAIDDLNDWVGCLGGHPQVKTPNIDRLAKRGVLFTNAHCAAPACNPSRAALFSGKMPYNTGVWSNSSPRLQKMRPDLLLLPHAFKKSGYVTLGTGKLLHGGGKANRILFAESFFPEQRWSPFQRDQVKYTEKELPSKGTDNPRHVINITGKDSIVIPFNRMPSDRKPNGNDGESFDWGPVDVQDSEMGDGKITDWAIGHLEQGFDKPFFLAVGYYRPHIPLWVPRAYFDLYPVQNVKLPPFKSNDLNDLSELAKRWAIEPVTAGSHATVVRHKQWPAAVAGYLACISFVDHQVGRLLDTLDAGRYGKNTLIVLWSDHGWHLGEKEHWGKWTGWERSTRVPMIIVPPKIRADEFAAAGSRCIQPVGLIDLYPTLTEFCNVTPSKGLDGQSLVPLLRNPALPTGRAVITTFDAGNVTLRTIKWRYIRYADGSEELYNHQTDPNEWSNLAKDPKYAELVKDLRNRVPAAAKRQAIK